METSLAALSNQSLARRNQRASLGRPVMLSPEHALEVLDARLGIAVGRSTFYRWVHSGRVFAIKLGGKIYVPLAEMESVVDRLSRGARL